MADDVVFEYSAKKSARLRDFVDWDLRRLLNILTLVTCWIFILTMTKKNIRMSRFMPLM